MSEEAHESLVRVQRAAQGLGFECSPAQAQTLVNYLRQLQRWNRTYNLTALRTHEQMLVQHVFDSLAVVPAVRRSLARQSPDHPLVLDVGSGAGLPGIVIAVFCEGSDVLCVDAVEKKVAFVRQLAAVLRLENLRACHSRIEGMEEQKAAVVISRAFASLPDFARLAGRHVRQGGALLAMKGKKPLEEISALEAGGDWRVEEVLSLDVPDLHAERCLVRMSQREGNNEQPY